MTTSDVHALSGAYALDALSDTERASFTRHLDDCATCALEVAELREAAARLADQSWAVPPPGLRTRVLAEIANTRQEHPGSKPRPGWSRSRVSRHLLTAAAAVLVAAGAATGTYAIQEHRVDEQRAETVAARAENDGVNTILSAPDATVRSGPVDGGGRVTVVASASHDAAVVTLTADHAPAADHAYQLWLTGDGGPVPAGMLPVGATSVTRVLSGTAAAQGIAVTIEPASGSRTPTFPLVASVRL
ncbi:Anti-sigma-K factor RskA [Asanoa hainanensis]|uniref:Regulator of SigK n=1 Tax=Asanoa hainanensis TaxID=560556 RepID=A0A239N5G5_9ACTN|nr:anti-sigma factor [Asanoa hainanensis]SNT50277.1 Anti-sigma-K factor RskA [Asanoa hainanensis]